MWFCIWFKKKTQINITYQEVIISYMMNHVSCRTAKSWSTTNENSKKTNCLSHLLCCWSSLNWNSALCNMCSESCSSPLQTAAEFSEGLEKMWGDSGGLLAALPSPAQLSLLAVAVLNLPEQLWYNLLNRDHMKETCRLKLVDIVLYNTIQHFSHKSFILLCLIIISGFLCLQWWHVTKFSIQNIFTAVTAAVTAYISRFNI